MCDINEQCADYFRRKPGFQRIMEGLLRCYGRYGCAKGRVSLEDAGEDEREALEGIFGRNFSGQIRLQAADFEAALKESVYQDADLKTVLERYFRTTISTKRQRKQKKEDDMTAILGDMERDCKGVTSKRFLEAMAAKQADRGYLLLARELENAPKTLRKHMAQVLHAVDFLEARQGPPVRLAVLSAQATRDPHALDMDRLAGKLFVHLLALRIGRSCPQRAEDRDILYFDGGILCDSISSTVTQLGVILRTKAGEHPAFRVFRDRQECATLSLTNLAQLSGGESPTKKAYLVENQMVFSQICDRGALLHSPVICTSGQVQVAVLRLLDLLAASGTRLFYAGDFDGGGLSIALRLLNRYPNLELWHMTEEDYEACASDVRLSDSSLALLKQTEGTVLEPLAGRLRENGYAGYQELLLDRMLEDLTN